MNWLPQPLDQPPPGAIPARDLMVGDVILVDGYAADLVRIVPQPYCGAVTLIWGWDDDDKRTVLSRTLIDVVGWLSAQDRAPVRARG